MVNTGMNAELTAKYESLIKYLRSLESVAVAFSSGVDSTFLLYAAKEALGEKMMAVTAFSYLFPRRELTEAEEFCTKLGIRQVCVLAEELKIEGFDQNPADRCYLCKKDLFTRILQTAHKNGMAQVVEGSNLDDNGDYRPGLIAVAELGIKSPLRACGFSKQEIREMSRILDLPTWDKPSFACLASRFPYGEQITEEKLSRVDKAEQFLLDLGFHQFRVRIHGNLARIEILLDEFDQMMEEKTRTCVNRKLKECGFDYVTLDLAGYRTGSMNETLTEAEKKIR